MSFGMFSGLEDRLVHPVIKDKLREIKLERNKVTPIHVMAEIIRTYIKDIFFAICFLIGSIISYCLVYNIWVVALWESGWRMLTVVVSIVILFFGGILGIIILAGLIATPIISFIELYNNTKKRMEEVVEENIE